MRQNRPLLLRLCWACALASPVTFLTGDHVMQIGFGQISPSASATRDLGTRLSLYGFGGRCLKIRDVCMDFKPYFKVHNLVSVHPESIIVGQLTNLNMIFHVAVSVYRLVKIWNSPQFPPEFPNGQFFICSCMGISNIRSDAKYIWNNSYTWTAVVDQSEEWSSQ